MARLNIEDQFWVEVAPMVAKLGNVDEAIGNAVRWFRFAQEKHRKGRLITEDEFKENGFSEALIPFFAKRTPSGIQANGAKKHFEWLNQKVEAASAGGKKSAQRNRNSKGQLLPNNETDPSEVQAEPKVIQPSSSSSSSSSNSDSRSKEVPKPEKSRTTPQQKKLNAEVWDRYKSAYLSRYKVEPVRNAAVNSKISQIAQRLGPDAIEVVEFYVKHPKSFYVSNLHAIRFCLSDAESLRTQWARGRAITQVDIKNYESNMHVEQINQMLERGEI